MSTTTLPLPAHEDFRNLTGMIFGRLTVMGFAGKRKRGRAWWVCLCTCGKEVEIAAGSLQQGDTKSCGCLRLDRLLERSTRHSLSNSSEFKSWADMWARCTNPKNAGYDRYNSRTPPDSWKDFAVFYAELGPKPSPKHTLDRIDNDKPYGPGNCRWATKDVQCRNTSKNIWVIAADGQTKVLKDACKDSSLSYSSVYNKWRRGQTLEQASNGLLYSVE